MKNLFFTIPCILLLINTVDSQNLQITNAPPYNTANHLINNVFSDGSVNITNISVFADPSQYGFFYNGAAALNMDSGIVLATSQLASITNSPSAPTGSSPHLSTGTGTYFGFPWMGTSSNNNLLTVASSVPSLIGQPFNTPSRVNSACAISFDFVPQDDTMRFKFVFASDEWNTFPCSQYNDMFGFFVAGPGINGPFNAPPGYTNAENYALVPGTSIPITISSITSPFNYGSCNQPSNSQYYVTANSFGLTTTARTDTMEVVFPVQACETYNFTMAIANAQDVGLQSAVFLAGNSFGTKGSLDITVDPGYGLGGDSIVYEGCDSVDITFTRNDTALLEDSIFLSIFGDAVNGVDYSYIPDTLFFGQGQQSITISFKAFDDRIVEGLETLYIAIDSATIELGCTSFESDTLMLLISDPIPIDYTASSDTVMCTAPPRNVNVNISNGMPPYSYLWSNGNLTGQFSFPTPANDTAFSVRIIDACGVDTVFDTARITIQNPPTTIKAGSDTIDCETDNALVYVEAFNAMPGLQYQWNTSHNTSGYIQNNPLVTTNYFVTVSQQCAGYFFTDTFTLVVDNPPFTVELDNDTVDCTDPAIEIGPKVSYTTPNFTFEWSTNQTDSSIHVNPMSTTTYSVSVTDACGQQTVSDDATIVVLANPMTVTGSDRKVACTGDSTALEISIEGGYKPYTINWDFGGTDSIEPIIVNEPDTFTVRVTDICGIDTVEKTFTSSIQQYPRKVFENVENDSLLCPGDQYKLGPAEIKGGSGDIEITWNDWEDKYNLAYGITDTSLSRTVKVYDLCTRDTADTTVYVFVPDYEPVLLVTSPDTETCPGVRVPLFAEAEGGAESHGYSYTWNTGSDESSIVTFTQNSFDYEVTVTDICGNRATGEIEVLRDVPRADFESEFLDGFNVMFTNTSRRASHYYWQFGDGDTSTAEEPFHTYDEDVRRQVTLIAYNPAGCSDSVTKEIIPELRVFIPNAFSPNDDGVNDVFEIDGQAINDSRSVSKFEIRIFNRWGSEVFRSLSPDFKWDGTNQQGNMCQTGVYVYRIRIEGHGLQKIEKHGTVTILSTK